MQPRYIAPILSILLSSQPVLAEKLTLETGIAQNTMIELYTSEGCNSCPPAEHFLNSFKNKGDLWNSVIPLAFHVDYWDYIGWKDRFAQASFGHRQRSYAQFQRRSTVYTPAFFINGNNWRPGLFSYKMPENKPQQTGFLKVSLNEKTVTAQYQPRDKKLSVYQLNIALLGTGITTDIKAGENEGRKSMHEFVVLDHQQHRSKDHKWTFDWSPLTPHVQSLSVPGYAVAIWVTNQHNPSPLQATGSYLPVNFFTNP